ncbi:MAG: hypothetical protein ABEI52_05635 [Halobacteriaceae archaeon]
MRLKEERDYDKILRHLLTYYSDANKNEMFTQRCSQRIHPEFGEIFTPGSICTRYTDYLPRLTRKAFPFTNTQKNKIIRFYEQCDQYVRNLPLRKLYMLFNIDVINSKENSSFRKQALFFQIFDQYLYIKKTTNVNIQDFYDLLSTGRFTEYNQDEALQKYWNELYDTIENAPKVPKNCPIVLYRGTKEKETIYHKPFSTTTNIFIAKGYQDQKGFLNTYKVQECCSILPLFPIDLFPEESEVLISCENDIQMYKEFKRRRYYVVNCNTPNM